MFYNISNDFMVRVSEAYGHTMLQMFGGFSDKNLSDSKVLAILDNGTELSKLIAAWKEGAYELDEETSVILSTWNSNKMLKLVGNFSKGSFQLSANLVSQMLKYSKEIKDILAKNPPSAIKAEQKENATVALDKNSASIGTDKKSAKDKVTSVVVPAPAPITFKGYATIQAYLQGTYKFSQIDAEFYAMDNSAQKEYADYLKANTRPSFAEMKAKSVPVAPKSFADAKKDVASSETVKTSDHKNNATYQAAKKGRAAKEKNLVPIAPVTPVESASKGIPVSFSVQIKGTEREMTADNMTKAMNELADKTLERTIIHNNVERTEQKLVTRVPMGAGPNKYFFSLIQQRYIYNAKNLLTGKEIDGKEQHA